MALLTGLESVMKENAERDVDEMRQAITTWMNKKKKSIDAYRKLRSDFISSHPGLGDASEMELPAPTSIDEVASSLAELAVKLNGPRHVSTGGSASQPVSVSRSYLDRCLAELRHGLVGEIQLNLEQTISRLLGPLAMRLEETEATLTGLQHEVEAQNKQLDELAKKTAALAEENAALKEQLERDRRAPNLVIEGLSPNQTKEAAVEDLFKKKLRVEDVKPVEVRRLQQPQRGGGKLRLLVRLPTIADKATVLRNCKALKDTPDIKVWEDLTPEQQKIRRKLVPVLKNLRKKGKRAWIRGEKLFMIEHDGESPKVVNV